jgi:hypothetical protein
MMKARLQIKLTEVFGPLELIKEIFDSGYQVLVPDCDFISGSVINAKLPCPIFLCTSNIGLPQGDELGHMCPF